MEKELISKARVKELAEHAPKSGLCEIRLKDPKRSGTITVRGYNDGEGKFRPYVDQHGQERIKKVQRTIYLNLEKLDDRLTYEQVRLHPIYVDGARPVLAIVNHENEADDFVALKNLESDAMAIISNLKGGELKDFARILLIKVKAGSSDQVIKRVLYEVAEENPANIINEWNDDLKECKAIIRTGIEKGVFKYNQGRYNFKDQLMGTSFDLAVQWMKNNEDLIPSLRKEMK